MIRHNFKVPGRDCIDVPSSCPHAPNCEGRYGRHGEEWIYVSKANDGLTALSLTIYTDIFPEGSSLVGYEDDKPLAERRRGSDLSLHPAFPITEEEIQNGSKGNDCSFVVGGRCFGLKTTATGADDFFRKHGDPAQFEQADAFWTAFEAQHEEWGTEVRGQRKDTTHEQCKACGGSGVVKR